MPVAVFLLEGIVLLPVAWLIRGCARQHGSFPHRRRRRAAVACREWEIGGEPGPVTATAAVVHRAAMIAVEAVTADEPWTGPFDDPQTRRSRMAAAAWMLVLAGTDEDGGNADLTLASQLFRAAATS